MSISEEYNEALKEIDLLQSELAEVKAHIKTSEDFGAEQMFWALAKLDGETMSGLGFTDTIRIPGLRACLEAYEKFKQERERLRRQDEFIK